MTVILKGRKPTIYVHATDLTVDGKASEPSFGNDPIDVTTFKDEAHRNDPGLQSVTYSYTGLFNSATGRTHRTVVDLLSNNRVASVYPEGDAAGKPGIGMDSARAGNYRPGGEVGGVGELSAEIYQDGTHDKLISLATLSANTTSATLAAVDGGASAASGSGRFYVHVFTNVATGGTDKWVVHLEHAAADGTAYVDRATASFGSGTIKGTMVAYTGTLLRYRRVTAILHGTGGTLDVQAGFSEPQ
uniref:Uncharacterized protein n=1 Tax=viral metagenome TaxID=1070528 RepID=A0A6M3LKS3_9ZZZZ